MLFPAALAHLSGSSLAKIERAYKAIDPVTWLDEITAAADEIVNLPPIERSSAAASASAAACTCGSRPPGEHG